MHDIWRAEILTKVFFQKSGTPADKSLIPSGNTSFSQPHEEHINTDFGTRRR